MKQISFYFFVLFIFLYNPLSTFAQDNEAKDTIKKVSSAYVYAPSYPGGDKALKKFIKKNITYPPILDIIDGEGECVMNFTVNEDGSISNIIAKDCRVTHYNAGKMARFTDKEQADLLEKCARSMAKEGLRLIRKMKKWHPAVSNNIPISINFSLPLSFHVNYIDE